MQILPNKNFLDLQKAFKKVKNWSTTADHHKLTVNQLTAQILMLAVNWFIASLW